MYELTGTKRSSSTSSAFPKWLSSERGYSLSDLNEDDRRKYFRRFVRRWNDGALSRRYYETGPPPPPSMPPFPPGRPSTSTSAVPGPSTAATISPREEAESSDDEIGPKPPSPIGPTQPARPSHSDMRYAREAAQEQAALERKFERKMARKEVYERAEEIAPKLGGKEGRIAEKKAANAANKEMREKDTDAVVDEATLLGDGGGFAAA